MCHLVSRHMNFGSSHGRACVKPEGSCLFDVRRCLLLCSWLTDPLSGLLSLPSPPAYTESLQTSLGRRPAMWHMAPQLPSHWGLCVCGLFIHSSCPSTNGFRLSAVSLIWLEMLGMKGMFKMDMALGIPWWSCDWASVPPLQGAWVPSLVGNSDPTSSVVWPGNKQTNMENRHDLWSLTSWNLLLKVYTLIMIGPPTMKLMMAAKKGKHLSL